MTMYSVAMSIYGGFAAQETSLHVDCAMTTLPEVIKYCHYRAESSDSAIAEAKQILINSRIKREPGKYVDANVDMSIDFDDYIRLREDQIRRDAVSAAIESTGSKLAAAKMLNIDRKTLYRWLGKDSK